MRCAGGRNEGDCPIFSFYQVEALIEKADAYVASPPSGRSEGSDKGNVAFSPSFISVTIEWGFRACAFAPDGGSSMNGIVDPAVDYKNFFEQTVLQLFESNGKLETANQQLADTRQKLSQTQLNFEEYQANMQVILIGGSVVIVTLVLVVVFITARQGVRIA
jgi:hypothetical protein